MAYRRAALVAVDGFDERFPRAYREDADLALRVRRRRLAPRGAARARSCTRCGPAAPAVERARCRRATPTTR